MSNLLKVKNIDMREDKNNNPYKYIEVSNYPHKLVIGPDGTNVKVRQMSRTIGITAWDKREVGEYSFAKDPAFDLKMDESFEAEIVTRKVPAYDIVDGEGEVRTVDTYTCVVFGSSDDKSGFEAAISQEFKRRDHDLSASPLSTPATATEQIDIAEEASPELSTAEKAAANA